MDTVDDDEDHQAGVQFEKCRAGVTLYRKDSMRSTVTEVREEPRSRPLSPTSKTKEISALTETISSMARLRMDDQRCSLTRVGWYQVLTDYFSYLCAGSIAKEW